jgi:hypothetical protein
MPMSLTGLLIDAHSAVGDSRPGLACRGCAARITDATRAGALWPQPTRDAEGHSAGVLILCEACLVRHPQWPLGPWARLHQFLFQLLANVGCGTPEQLERAAFGDVEYRETWEDSAP